MIASDLGRAARRLHPLLLLARSGLAYLRIRILIYSLCWKNLASKSVLTACLPGLSKVSFPSVC